MCGIADYADYAEDAEKTPTINRIAEIKPIRCYTPSGRHLIREICVIRDSVRQKLYIPVELGCVKFLSPFCQKHGFHGVRG